MVEDNYRKRSARKAPAQVITFYSYKGGVGRSMALANIAALLAKWGKRILIIDWDLEAPGLENFFKNFLNTNSLLQKKGLIDLLLLNNKEINVDIKEIPWLEYITQLKDDLSNLYILTAGKKDDQYSSKMRSFSISKFFEKDGGAFLEGLRNYWLDNFDFVFIDSRTGLTDSSGVCSIHLPDVLVLLFSLNEQSLAGSMEVASKAIKAHAKIIYDRLKLKVLPVPTRIENNESLRREEWLQRISEELVPLFSWLPRNKSSVEEYSITPKELINQIKVPYIPEYAYGEQLPSIEKGTNDPQDIAYVYETIAAIIGNDFNNLDFLKDSRDNYIKSAKGETKQEGREDWLHYLPKRKKTSGIRKWDVFLSYPRGSRSWVLDLYDVLSAEGYRVFVDAYVLSPGDDIKKVVEEGIEDSSMGIFIWSVKASEAFRYEYDQMVSKATYDKDFQFIPVIVGDSSRETFENENHTLPSFIDRGGLIDFTAYPDGPNGGSLLRLLYALAEVPLYDEALEFANGLDEATQIAFAKVNAAIKNQRPEKLLQLFREGGLPWKITGSLACKTAEGLIKMKNLDDAIDILAAVERDFRESTRPRQLRVLALARRGLEKDLDEAQDILGDLYAHNFLDPETLGIYGRILMDRYRLSGNVAELRQSRNYYAEAFAKAPDDYYTGINAASKSIILGDIEKGKLFAEKVQEQIGDKPISGDYWLTATIAEALLIQGKYKEAAEIYQRAIDIAPSEIQFHQSTARQAKMLLKNMEANERETKTIENVFRVEKMAKKVFISYDHSEDRPCRDLLRAWSANIDFEFQFDQRSPNEAINSSNSITIKQSLTRMMKEVEYILVIIGKKSHQSKWMEWEIDRAKQHDINLKVAAVKLDNSYITPSALLPSKTAFAKAFTMDEIIEALNNAKRDY
jgi:MinD-like ATPase involved in chromosome partitioning or flagellar assembly